jgi:ketosteroid isomerase-like protein
MIKEQAKNLLATYGKAWVERDADLILAIFTPDATYFDPAEGEVRGHDGIRKYWQEKVIACQRDISFKLLNVWIDEGGATVIAEWDAEFTDTARNLRIDMTEVAIFGVKDGKFSSLREYYRSVKKPL